MAKFTKEEILMNRAKFDQLPTNYATNLLKLVDALNALFANHHAPITVSSGYRPPEINNSTANASATSWHLQCAAVDLQDKDGKVWQYVLGNLELCKQLGLWLEDKRWTPTWVHLQIYPPKSGNRIFVPSSKPALAPKAWNGNYDSKFN